MSNHPPLSQELPVALSWLPSGSWSGAQHEILLTYDARFLRRKRLSTLGGASFLVDLPETVSLGPGDALLLEDGTKVAVLAAEEPLVEITGSGLPRLAWHIGNRHTPCQIEPERLLIRRDHVLQDMLMRLGAVLRLVEEPFRPEGGAYGFGRTLGHTHGAEPFGHDHHGPGHDHDHPHTHLPAQGEELGTAQGSSHGHFHRHSLGAEGGTGAASEQEHAHDPHFVRG